MVSKNRTELVLYHAKLCENFYLRFYLADNDNCQLESPSDDYLIVFYIPDKVSWRVAVQQLSEAGFNAVRSFNPYWDISGKTFTDSSGYRVVLQNSAFQHYKVRLARPTNNLDLSSKYYVDNFSLVRVGNFRGHEGFDGDILADESSLFQFELTYAQSLLHDGRLNYSGHSVCLYISKESSCISDNVRVDPDGFGIYVRRYKDFQFLLSAEESKKQIQGDNHNEK